MTLTLELPDDLAIKLIRLPEGERKMFAVAAIRRQVEKEPVLAEEKGLLHEWQDAATRVSAFNAFLTNLHKNIPKDTPLLSDFAVSRDGIYED